MKNDFYTKKSSVTMADIILIIASILCVIATIVVFIFFNKHQKNKNNNNTLNIPVSTSEAADSPNTAEPTTDVVLDPIIPSETTIGTRFNPPAGYKRVNVSSSSFGEYLRNFKLREYKVKPLAYDTASKTLANNDSAPAVSVLDMDLINKSNLQEASNSVIRLYSEFLYKQGRFDDIAFNLLTTPAFRLDFRTWSEGGRLIEEGNSITWCKEHGDHCKHRDVDTGTEYGVFKYYMQNVMLHSNISSLRTNMNSISLNEVTVGDIIFYADSKIPDIIVDIAENSNGNKLVLLARGGNPASEIFIVRNESNTDLNPWHDLNKLLAGASFYRFE